MRWLQERGSLVGGRPNASAALGQGGSKGVLTGQGRIGPSAAWPPCRGGQGEAEGAAQGAAEGAAEGAAVGLRSKREDGWARALQNTLGVLPVPQRGTLATAPPPKFLFA